MTETLYKHTPLVTATSFRLLELLPGKWDEEVECRLHPTEVTKNPGYEAVSYVWGEDHDQSFIKCDGSYLKVPNNLVDGLRRLRHEADPRMLWADSVCIDQDDKPEKVQQIRLMGHIYKNAERVLIWLGEGDEASDYNAVQCIVELAQAHSVLSGFAHDDLYADNPSRLDLYNMINAQISIPHPESARLSALCTFLQNPWFHRAWTFQEYILARERILIRGKFGFSSDYLIVATLAVEILSTLLGGEQYWSIRGDRLGVSSYMTIHSDSLLSLLRWRRTARCKLDHDLIYSLLSLVNHQVEIVIDYDFPLVSLFSQVWESIVKSEQNLEILSDANSHRLDEVAEIPSWMPDWRCADTNVRMIGTRAKMFDCARDTAPVISLLGTMGKLSVRGGIFDRVGRVFSGATDARRIMLHIADRVYSNDRAERLRLLSILKPLCCEIVLGTSYDGPVIEQLIQRWHSIDREAAFVTAHTNMSSITDLMTIAHQVEGRSKDMNFVKTSGGHRGMAPLNAQAGDIIVVLLGSRSPVILRPVEYGSEFRFVGLCYVEGFVDGEALDLVQAGVPIEQFDMSEVLDERLVHFPDWHQPVTSTMESEWVVPTLRHGSDEPATPESLCEVDPIIPEMKDFVLV